MKKRAEPISATAMQRLRCDLEYANDDARNGAAASAAAAGNTEAVKPPPLPPPSVSSSTEKRETAAPSNTTKRRDTRPMRFFFHTKWEMAQRSRERHADSADSCEPPMPPLMLIDGR